MKVPDGLEALNFTKDDIGTLVKGALPQVRNIKKSTPALRLLFICTYLAFPLAKCLLL